MNSEIFLKLVDDYWPKHWSIRRNRPENIREQSDEFFDMEYHEKFLDIPQEIN